MISAIDFGTVHSSCPEAMRWRVSLGPDATQADAWRRCERGDWLIWQLRRLPRARLKSVLPALRRATEKIATRAGLAHALYSGVPGVGSWPRLWLCEEDRSEWEVRAAFADAEWAAVDALKAAWTAQAAELRSQAADIRAEIPEWPDAP